MREGEGFVGGEVVARDVRLVLSIPIHPEMASKSWTVVKVTEKTEVTEMTELEVRLKLTTQVRMRRVSKMMETTYLASTLVGRANPRSKFEERPESESASCGVREVSLAKSKCREERTQVVQVTVVNRGVRFRVEGQR